MPALFPPLISLASGYGCYPPPAVAVAAATAAFHQPGALPTGPAEGQLALREAIAAQYRQRGTAVEAEQVVITPGGKAALFAVLSSILKPGDEVLVPTPAWFGFWEVIRRAGGTVRTVPLSAEDGYVFEPEQLAAALTPRTRLLILTNPNNPTGRLYCRAELAALLAVTRQYPNLRVLSDEIYDGVVFAAEHVPTLLSFPDPHQQHIVLNGYSKSLGLVGWGVGYLVAPPALAQACTAWQFATGAAVPLPLQAAAQAATEAAASVTAALLACLTPTRSLLLTALATLPHVPAMPSPGGTYYAFPDLRAYLPAGATPLAAAALVQHLATHGVAVVDGASCGAPGFVRISYAVEPALLKEGMRRLAHALNRRAPS